MARVGAMGEGAARAVGDRGGVEGEARGAGEWGR